MKGKSFIIIKKLRNTVYAIFAIFVIVFLMLILWQNVDFKPIKINDSDSVEKIEISLNIIEDAMSYELKIEEKDLIEEFVDRTSNVKAKKIINGGGTDANVIIYIEVHYIGGRLKQYTICGNQILLKDEKEAYRMSESESEKLHEYMLLLLNHNGMVY